MPWVKPGLKQLTERAGQDLSVRLLDGAALKPNSTLSVLAVTRAGGEYLIYGHLEWAFRQIFPDQAEAEFLENWAAVWGVSRKPAAAASGPVTVTGRPGSALPDEIQAKTAEGQFYRLTGLTLPGDPEDSGEVSAKTTAEAALRGAAGNLAAGARLTLISPAAGLKSEIVVAAGGLTGGVDVESDEDLRARLLAKIQEPPHGGNKSDYEQWALEVPGVVNALCYPTYAGLGTVGVAVWGEVDDPVLPASVVQRAYEHILELCPVTAGPGLYVFTPEVMPVDFTIMLNPDSPQVRANVGRELGDVFAREGRPGTVIVRSHLTEAISLAAGEYDHQLIAPAGNIIPAANQLPILGEITFIGDGNG